MFPSPETIRELAQLAPIQFLLVILTIILFGIFGVLIWFLRIRREETKAKAKADELRLARDAEQDKDQNRLIDKGFSLFATLDASIRAHTEMMRTGFNDAPDAITAKMMPPIRQLGDTTKTLADRNLEATNQLRQEVTTGIAGISSALRTELAPLYARLDVIKEDIQLSRLASEKSSANSERLANELSTVQMKIVEVVERVASQNGVHSLLNTPIPPATPTIAQHG